jgi:hypothetical protein
MIPYCATFTIFTDYMRGAIRIAALSQAGTIFVTTHDSIAAACLKQPLWVVLSVLDLFTLSLVHVADSLRRLISMQCIYGVPKSAGASVATVGLLRALLCFYFLAPVYRCLIFWSCLYLELGELWRIQVGEDGPTHQPIETIPSLRLIPDLTVMRPADGNETAGAYKHFGQKDVKRMSQRVKACQNMSKHF